LLLARRSVSRPDFRPDALPSLGPGPVRDDDSYAFVRVLSVVEAKLDDPTRDAVKKILFEEWSEKKRDVASIGNGDLINGSFVGRGGPTDTPNVAHIIELMTISGGTGRFQGATGEFTTGHHTRQRLFRLEEGR
jgi:hypothetical protein